MKQKINEREKHPLQNEERLFKIVKNYLQHFDFGRVLPSDNPTTVGVWF